MHMGGEGRAGEGAEGYYAWQIKGLFFSLLMTVNT